MILAGDFSQKPALMRLSQTISSQLKFLSHSNKALLKQCPVWLALRCSPTVILQDQKPFLAVTLHNGLG